MKEAERFPDLEYKFPPARLLTLHLTRHWVDTDWENIQGGPPIEYFVAPSEIMPCEHFVNL